MSTHQFVEITAGIANIAIAVAVLVFVMTIVLKYRAGRRDRTVGAPPIERDR